MPRSPHLTSRRGGSTPLLALLLLLFVVASGAGTARADSSDLAVAYQVNVAHSGVQTDLSIKPPLQRRWAVTLPATVSYPLIAEGMVFVTTGYTSTDVKTLYALDQATGHVVWSQPLPF